MQKPPELSIVIISYNTREYLQACLDALKHSLKASGVVSETIVIDNGSTDGSRQMLKQKYPWVHTVFNRKNQGFGRANNTGISKASGEYILLLNSDAFVVENGIERMLAFAKRHPRAFIGGKLYNRDGTPQPSCGPFYSLPIIFLILFARGDRLKITRYSPQKPTVVDWVSGACLMGPKRLYEDDLLFDEQIFMYTDEIDLLYRAKMKGYRTYFFPNARFIHIGSGSSGGDRKLPVLSIYRGLVYLYRKHRPRWEISVLLLFLRLKAVIALLVGYLTGNAYLQDTYAEALRLAE